MNLPADKGAYILVLQFDLLGRMEIGRLALATALGDCYLRETPPEPAREPARALSNAACQRE